MGGRIPLRVPLVKKAPVCEKAREDENLKPITLYKGIQKGDAFRGPCLRGRKADVKLV